MPRLRCALTEERTSHISIWDLACMHSAHTVTSGIITNYQGKCWKNKQHTSNPCVCAAYSPGEVLLVNREKGGTWEHVSCWQYQDKLTNLHARTALCEWILFDGVYMQSVFSFWTEWNFQNKLDVRNKSIIKILKTFVFISIWLMLAVCCLFLIFCFSDINVKTSYSIPFIKCIVGEIMI